MYIFFHFISLDYFLAVYFLFEFEIDELSPIFSFLIILFVIDSIVDDVADFVIDKRLTFLCNRCADFISVHYIFIFRFCEVEKADIRNIER